MPPPYVSLKAKLGVAAVIVLLEAIVFAGCWGVLAFSGSDRTVPDLPPLASLTETSGTVVGFATSQHRTRSYYAPIVTFAAPTGPQQIVTRASYNRAAIPFRQGDAVRVLYDRANPAAGWLRWEYERAVQDATTPRFADIVETVMTYGALGIGGLTIVGLIVYMRTPIKAD